MDGWSSVGDDRGSGWLDDPVDRLVGVVVVVAVVWNLAGNLVLPGSWYVPANLAVAAGLIVLSRRAGLGWDTLGLRSDRLRMGLAVGLGTAVVVAGVLAIGLAIPAVEGAFEDDAVRADSTFERWFVPLVRIPLGTAVFEETLFRAVLLGVLLDRRPTRTAVAVSSVAFGLWHIVPALETTGGSALAVAGGVAGTVALTTAAGVGFALLRLWSGSVLAPILAHAATNGLAYAAAVVALEVLD